MQEKSILRLKQLQNILKKKRNSFTTYFPNSNSDKLTKFEKIYYNPDLENWKHVGYFNKT